MKSAITYIILLFLSCSGIVSAQNFFPLKVGNIYQFKKESEHATPSGGYETISYYVSSVVFDTLIAGKTFYKFSKTPLGDNLLFTYDSLVQKLLIKRDNDDTARVAVDFNIPADSTFQSYIYGPPENLLSEGRYSRLVFGDSILTYSIFNMHIGPDGPQHFYFSEGLGLIQNKWAEYFINYRNVINEYIISAIIDSIEYNPINLQIDYISPLIDRPINSFPFVLSGACSTYDQGLIDSFFVDILHVRSDSVIYSWKLDFDEGHIILPIYQNILEVGDQIKVRGKATEISFYQNEAYYPDSGWAIINVLPNTVDVSEEFHFLEYGLKQNYPNPFNPSTTISFSIPERVRVTLRVYDILGNEITTLINEEREGGNHTINFDASELTSGIYFYRLTSGSFTLARKMLLLK